MKTDTPSETALAKHLLVRLLLALARLTRWVRRTDLDKAPANAA